MKQLAETLAAVIIGLLDGIYFGYPVLTAGFICLHLAVTFWGLVTDNGWFDPDDFNGVLKDAHVFWQQLVQGGSIWFAQFLSGAFVLAVGFGAQIYLRQHAPASVGPFYAVLNGSYLLYVVNTLDKYELLIAPLSRTTDTLKHIVRRALPSLSQQTQEDGNNSGS